LRPAAAFCARLSPLPLPLLRLLWLLPLLLAPRLEDPGELEIAAALDFSSPFYTRTSYCLSSSRSNRDPSPSGTSSNWAGSDLADYSRDEP
jgi:hypothetical protein